MQFADTVPPLQRATEPDKDYRWLAVVLLAAWAIDLNVRPGLGTAPFVGLLLVPLWLPALRRFRMARGVLVVGVLSLLSGVLLAVLQMTTRPYGAGVAFGQAMELVLILTGFGLILWAREFLSAGAIAVVLGASSLVGRLAQTTDMAGNFGWKAGVALPVSLIVLGLVFNRSTWLQMGALAGLAVTYIAFETRSGAGLCVLAASLLFVQRIGFRPPRGWFGPVLVAVMASVAVYGVYTLGNVLAVSGRLGDELAQRSREQVLRTGSLIAGSRPEWIGSIGLIGEHPAGYGFGAEPMYEDVWIARQGLYTVGIGSDNGYVDNYMFGGFFRLHSGAADLWAQTGLVGLACALGLVLVVFGGISARLRNRTLTALVSFLSLNTLWDIGFSPLQSASLGIAVTLGFLLMEHPPGADRKPEGVGRPLH